MLLSGAVLVEENGFFNFPFCAGFWCPAGLEGTENWVSGGERGVEFYGQLEGSESP